VQSLTNTDLFALYIAAIGHDVGHPGFSNVFMVCSLFLSRTSILQLTSPSRKTQRHPSRPSTTTSPRSSKCTARSCSR
jgi:hypothetical protein